MEADTLVNVITVILAVGNFICLYSISRKKAYNEEKGKNLATKEDIDEITEIIESVKNEISFESQRKHTFVEQRTNRHIEILHLAEELQLYKKQLLFYLYDHYCPIKVG